MRKFLKILIFLVMASQMAGCLLLPFPLAQKTYAPSISGRIELKDGSPAVGWRVVSTIEDMQEEDVTDEDGDFSVGSLKHYYYFSLAVPMACLNVPRYEIDEEIWLWEFIIYDPDNHPVFRVDWGDDGCYVLDLSKPPDARHQIGGKTGWGCLVKYGDWGNVALPRFAGNGKFRYNSSGGGYYTDFIPQAEYDANHKWEVQGPRATVIIDDAP